MTKVFLGNIAVIRLVLILCIVIGHAFAIFSGAWSGIESIDIHEACAFYKFINPIFISFQLPAFVFISGYLLGKNKVKVDEKNFVVQKFKRLYVPALVFGVLYYFLFVYQKNDFSASLYVYGGEFVVV